MKKMLVTVAVATMVLFSGLTFAQEEENAGLFDLNANYAVGYGSMFAEEGETFTRDAQFLVGSVDILGINLFDATSGVSVEVSLGGDLQYKVWSLNRANVPGVDRAYVGSDLKLVQSTNEGGAQGDFDLRLVTGYVLGRVGPGELRLEFRGIEEDKPIAFAVMYGF